MEYALQPSIRTALRLRPMPKHKPLDLVYVFTMGGLFGSLYEICFIYALNGFFQNRTGSVLTPFNYVYGVGAVAIFVAFHKTKSAGKVAAMGILLGGAVEYVLSFLQELFLGSRSWDYTGRPLNINGRTTLLYMLFWGFLCYVAIRFLFPAVIRTLRKMPAPHHKIIAVGLILLIGMDALVSLSVVHRYTQRAAGIPATNAVVETIDEVFDDSYMESHFPNMTPHS